MNAMLIPYQENRNQFLQEFEEAFNSKDIRYYLSDYLNREELNSTMISDAINRATSVCYTADLPVHKHFKKIYRIGSGSVALDWRLSHLGFYLTIINANPRNPKVARLQTCLYDFFSK
jgi:hypothetical protein